MRFITSLKRALILYFILAAAVPVVLFAFFTSNYINDFLLEDVVSDNLFLAGELRAQTEDFLNQPITILNHINKVIHEGKLINQQGIDAYLEREVRGSGFFESVYILDRQGKVVNLGVNSKLESQKQDYFSIDLSSQEFFRLSLRQRVVSWSDTFISVVTGEPSITVGLPVENGILVGNLSLSRLNRIITRFSHAENIALAIIDRKGNPIAHSSPEMAVQRVSMMFHPEVKMALATGDEVGLHTHEDNNLLETVLNIPETGWVVWIGRDRSAVLAPVDNVRKFMLLTLSFSIFIGIFLAFLNSRKLMRPIAGLVDGVKQLADGDYEIRSSKKSYKEIDELAAGFNRMSLAVMDREGSIREREERFRNLVNSIEGIVWEFDVALDAYIFVSKRCEQLLGCSYQQWLESPDFWKKHIHPDDRQWVVDCFQGLKSGRLSPQFEYRMIDTAGRVIWVRNMVNVIYNNKKPIRLYGVIIDINERKQSEIALRESELRFRSLVEQAADSILIHDRSGRLVEVNDQAIQTLGYSREELLKLAVPDIEEAHDPVQFSSLLTSVLHGSPLTLETEYRRKDGSRFPVEVSIGSFISQDAPMLLALVRDITARKKADAALRASEERYRSVVTAMSEGVVLFDRDGQLVASNPAAEAILQQSHAQLSKQSTSTELYAVKEDGSRFEIDSYPFNLTLKDGHSFENVIMGLPFNKSGKVKTWLQINTQPVMLGVEKRPSGVVATFTDVTERRLIVTALQESEEQVRLLLNSTAEGIYGIDIKGCCTFCNPAGLELLGYESEDDLLGRNMHKMIHHSHIDNTPFQEKTCPIINAVYNLETVQVADEVFWREDGSWFYTEYWAHPIIKDGESIGAVVTFHDITERKMLQQQSVRTAQLASLGELAAGVAHEINNPINGVINYAQILLNRLEKSGLETDLADRIIKEGERIATIVKDLLFFAREGGAESKLSDIADVLGEALSLTEAQIRKEGILLNIDIAEDLPQIMTRAQQIQQLFLNVLSNSRHALNEKYPGSNENKIIEISLHSVKKQHKVFIQATFRDYGIGIPAAMLESVMNPFVTSKPAGIGTGLGLSISHEIVRSHNGEIRIESKEGEWTAVVIELPAVEKEQE